MQNTLLEHVSNLSQYKEAFGSVNACIQTIRKSALNTMILLETQRKAAIAHPKQMITGANTRWTYDARAARRAMELLKFIKDIPVADMYFKNANKRREWTANLKQWQHEAQYVLQFVLPILNRVEFWTVFNEQSHSPTASFRRYFVDDLDEFGLPS